MTWVSISVILYCACVFGTINAGKHTDDRNYGQEKLKPNPRIDGKTAEIQSNYGLSDFSGILNKFGKPTNYEYDKCDNVFQYPINLPIDAAIAKYGKLNLKGFQYTYDGTIAYEEGDIVLTFSDDKQVQISDGGLPGTFYLYQIRIKTPSANTVAGIHYPIEIQYIFINMLYEYYEVASTHADGLAVASVFVTAGSDTNPAFAAILANLAQFGDEDFDLDDPFSPGSLLPAELCSFFRYCGKFSEETCEQIATFTLFTDTIHISEEQLQELLEFLADQITTTTEPTTTTSTTETTVTETTVTETTVTETTPTTPTSGGYYLPLQHSNKRKKRPQQHKRPRILDFSAYKPKRGPIVTIQPIMFCKSPLLDTTGFPWYLFHKH